MARPQSAAIVDVPAAVAEWLVSFGAIKAGPTVLNSHSQEIRQLRASEWVDVQNGKARAARSARRSAQCAQCAQCAPRSARGPSSGSAA